MNAQVSTTAKTSGAQSAVRFVLPVIVFAAGLAAWELVVRVREIPPYVLPAPSVIFLTLIKDWAVLSQSLATTLLTTLEGFVAASIGGIALALLFNQGVRLSIEHTPHVRSAAFVVAGRDCHLRGAGASFPPRFTALA